MHDLGVDSMYFEAREQRALKEVEGSYTYFADDDVLLAKITPCFENGKLGIARGLTNGIGFGSSEYFVLRPDRKLLPQFLYYFLSRESFREEGAKVMTGAVGHRRVPKEFIESYAIPLPSVDEQRRVVAMLDQALDGIAKAKRNNEASLANVDQLLDSTRFGLLDEIGSRAEWLTLQELLDRGWILSHLDGNHGSEYPRKEEFVTKGVPYISANCIDDEKVDMSLAKYLLPQRAVRIRKGVAQSGDVLFAHNATVGPVAVLETAEPCVILGTSLTYYRCNRANISPRYLGHYMRSRKFREQYEQIMRQSTRNQVPITKQREFFHLIPNIKDQIKVAAELDTLELKRLSLRELYQRKLVLLNQLKQSLLWKAFSGELTDARGLAA